MFEIHRPDSLAYDGNLSGTAKEQFSLKLSKGIYFISLNGKAGSAMKKFIVQ